MPLIVVAANTPLSQQPMGTVPDVSGALQDTYQIMYFDVVTKATVGFQVVETTTPVQFFGNIQPFTPREIELRPEGQRAWTWFWVHSTTALPLGVDDVINYLNVQYRVKGVNPAALYGYYEYQLVQDYTGSGPSGA